jgi:hypothetical protein
MMGDTEDQEVQSPLKKQSGDASVEKGKVGAGASRQLDLQGNEFNHHPPRKRKSKVTGPATQTPDLNIPVDGSSAIVPVGLVNSMVNQLDGGTDNSGDSMIETLKKQKRGNTHIARSAAAASSSPRRAP